MTISKVRFVFNPQYTLMYLYYQARAFYCPSAMNVWKVISADVMNRWTHVSVTVGAAVTSSRWHWESRPLTT